MAILDPPVPVVDTAVEGAKKVRRRLLGIVNGIDGQLKGIRELVALHGRSSIQTELGGDSADLLVLYNSLVAVLESTEVGRTIDPLP